MCRNKALSREEKGTQLFLNFRPPLRKETAMPRQRHSPRRGFPRLPFAVSKDERGKQVCFAYEQERNRIGCAPPARATSTLRWRDEDASSALFGADGSAFGDRFRFSSRELDGEEALQYSRVRHYDPTPGRWLNEDPISFDASEDHVYSYPAASSSAASAGNP
jgi:RHS repeat-associated protein